MKIRKGDLVQVISGKDVGKQGQVLMSLPDENKVIVKGVNHVIKHKKDTGDKNKPGGRIKVEAPIDASNVMLVDPQTGEPTRIGYEVEEKTGSKFRISKKSNKRI